MPALAGLWGFSDSMGWVIPAADPKPRIWMQGWIKEEPASCGELWSVNCISESVLSPWEGVSFVLAHMSVMTGKEAGTLLGTSGSLPGEPLQSRGQH